jgi:hypothetical protein
MWTASLDVGKVMDVHHSFEIFKQLLILYGLIMIPMVVISRFLLSRKKEETYTMTDHRGYKIVVILDFKMRQDERYEALKEIGLRPLEYKTHHLPSGVFKVEILNAHEYDNA